MSNNNAANQLSKAQVKELLWRRASLGWLMDSNQKALYELFHGNPKKIHTWLLARRSGKSFTLCVLAIEYCLKNPNSIIKYVAPQKNQVTTIIRPIITEILSNGCPDDLKPEFSSQRAVYVFSNGSELQLAGADAGNIESIRGSAAHICIVDEAQSISELKNAVNSVLLPTTLTTKGKIIISGTPSLNPDHEFNFFIEKAEGDGTLIKRTVYDNPRLTKEDIQEQIDGMGGADTDEFKREFLCERIRSKKTTVIPEFDEAREKLMVMPWIRPAFYHPYSSMDLGFRDMTVVLFAYYDFHADKLIIEDEIVRHGDNMHLATLAKDIEEKERNIWVSAAGENIAVRRRVSDHDLIAIQEIKKASNYRVIFEPADKRDMMGGINFLRTLIKNNKVIVNPRCTVTINHLRNAKWTKGATDKLARGADDSHYDAIPALSYLMRGVDWSANPYPKNYNSKLRPEDVHYARKPDEFPNKDVYLSMLGLGKKK